MRLRHSLHGHHNHIPTDPDRETTLLEVSRSVVWKIPFRELPWAAMKRMDRGAIRIDGIPG